MRVSGVPAFRKKINSQVHAIARGVLHLSDDVLRAFIANAAPDSDGHISRCDDETANLILIRLRREVDARAKQQKAAARGGATTQKQQAMIARLMSILGWRWSSTAKLCKRVTGIDRTDRCDSAQLAKLLRAMIAIIDKKLSAGEIQMSHTERFDYDRHVRPLRPAAKDNA